MKKKSAQLLVIVTTLVMTQVITASSSSKEPIVTRSSKANLPTDLAAQAKQVKMSILTPSAADLLVLYQNYPSGSLLFPNNPDVASAFDTMIMGIKANPDFIEFFRKVHIRSLNKLYDYLMKVYTNFNLTNPGCLQNTDPATADVSAYLIDESTYATNKKKLIMNHFINLVQDQFASSIVSYAPASPFAMAATLGKVFIENDYGLNLKDFISPTASSVSEDIKKKYFTLLGQYITFSQTYTSYLEKINTNGTSQYYTMAQSVYDFLHPNGQDQTTSLMNPGMFFYHAESMRSIKFIPFTATTLPAKSKLIPWAPSIVNAAVKNLSMNGHPIAYFKDASGKSTSDQSKAKGLYLLTETGSTLFEQELLAQPAWLNNKSGVIRILSACLGNFSALVGTGILDTTTEMVIEKSLGKNSFTSTQTV